MTEQLPEYEWDAEFLQRVGAIVVEWGTVESMIHMILWREAQLDGDRARWLTAGMTWGDALERAKSFHLARTPDDEAAVGHLQADLGRLAGKRNLVVHCVWGVDFGTNQIRFTDVTGRSAKKLQQVILQDLDLPGMNQVVADIHAAKRRLVDLFQLATGPAPNGRVAFEPAGAGS